MEFKLTVTMPSGTIDIFPTNWSNLCELRREKNNEGFSTQSFVKYKTHRVWRPPLFSDRLY